MGDVLCFECGAPIQTGRRFCIPCSGPIQYGPVIKFGPLQQRSERKDTERKSCHDS